MIDRRCLYCDYYDPDCECICSSFDMIYACPIEKHNDVTYSVTTKINDKEGVHKFG